MNPEQKREYMKAYSAAYRVKHRARLAAMKKAWLAKAKAAPAWVARRAEYTKAYRQRNRAKSAAYAASRIRKDESARIACRVRTKTGHMIRAYLRGQRSSRVNLYCGCPAMEMVERLFANLPAGAAPEDYGTKWVVDHVYPLGLADLTVPAHRLAAFHWSNVRAVRPIDNSRKYVACSDEASRSFLERVRFFESQEGAA